LGEECRKKTKTQSYLFTCSW